MPTDGELWARAELERLLDRGFRPRAVAGFLAASQRRANQVRRERPEVARREAAWAIAGAAAWLGLAAHGVEPFRRRAAAGLGGWALTILMLDWHLGMLETPEGDKRNLGAADAATLLRAWLIPAVAGGPSPLLCTIGFGTDMLDGQLARATRSTRLGRDLEGLVDAAFSAAALCGNRRGGRSSRMATVAEAVRMGVGFAYAVACYFGRAKAPDARVLRAGRAIAPARAAGVLLSAAGRDRLGGALLLAGSAVGTAVVARSLISSGA
ncbi:MAG: CDP-alcohol phosphatidyltransferase family protein [Solirubrobacteraceae bacterium]